MINIFFTLIVALFIISCSSNNHNINASKPEKEIAEIIPITTANLRGHKALYKEGWFVVTSSEKAFNYAKEKSILSSRAAIATAASSIAQRNDEFRNSLLSNFQSSIDITQQTFKRGEKLTQKIADKSETLMHIQFDYSQESFRRSWESLVKGNLYLGERTEETRENLRNQPGNYFDNLSSDFSNIYDITADMQIDFSQKIGNTWEDAFSESVTQFTKEYEQSGKSSNSLTGLAHILKGYAKGIYHGLFKPTAATATTTLSAGGRATAQTIFLPTSTVISVAGRTVQSLGNTIYYSGKLGIEIISPTIEAGFLSGMAILSLGSAPITKITGSTIGAVNQIAFLAASPVVGGVSAAANTAIDTGKYVTFVSYDAIKGSSKVLINQSSSAIVLGYNALTALPSHLFMGVLDSAVFLAWDGPRLVIATAKGELVLNDNDTRVDNLPVGSVVDLSTLKERGISVEVISDDPKIINNVMEQLPNDLRD